MRNLLCNPYTTGRLIIACEVTYGRTDGSVNILWTFQSMGSVTSSILNSSETKYTIIPRRLTSFDRSQLQVNSLTDSDAGVYACQIQLFNGTRATPSQQLALFSPDVFSVQELAPCSRFEAQSETAEQCAIIDIIDNPLPTTTGSPIIRMMSQGRGTSSMVASALGAIAVFVILVVQ